MEQQIEPRQVSEKDVGHRDGKYCSKKHDSGKNEAEDFRHVSMSNLHVSVEHENVDPISAAHFRTPPKVDWN
jgi:hypothetical protein